MILMMTMMMIMILLMTMTLWVMMMMFNDDSDYDNGDTTGVDGDVRKWSREVVKHLNTPSTQYEKSLRCEDGSDDDEEVDMIDASAVRPDQSREGDKFTRSKAQEWHYRTNKLRNEWVMNGSYPGRRSRICVISVRFLQAE